MSLLAINMQKNTSQIVQRMVGIWLVGLLLAGTASAQELSSREKRSIKSLEAQIDKAGTAFQAKRYSSSASTIKKVIKQVEKLAGDQPRKELVDGLADTMTKLQKAHELLSEQGQKLPELPGLGGNLPATGEAISFKESVAPILIAKCGNCHVNQSRGDFSAASYTALVNSTTIAFGKPNDSRLVEVIVNGEMPKGGGRVLPEELKTLKNWIAQGAKFDGDDRGQNLRDLASRGAAPMNRRTEIVKPKGNETVSFGLDLAPILTEQCADCHVTRRPRGNFSMASFRAFLRGGDGGTPVSPGKPDASALMKRLRGDGVRKMPPDRNLSPEVIAKFETWIKEGASFDGDDSNLDLVTVHAASKARSMSHKDLVTNRKKQTLVTWRLAMGDIKSSTVATENFVVAAAENEARKDEVSKMCESLSKKVATTLKLPKSEPLVKGNISIFLLSKRYDFGEFGRMVEKREFPRELKSYWNFDTINAYAVVLMTRNQSAEDIQVPLTQQMAALHVASLSSDVPRWFADGMGLWVAKRIHSNDDLMKSLDNEAELAARDMKRLDDFVQNRLPADQAAKVAYLFVNQLRSSSSPAFGKLMRNLRQGSSFENSFTDSFGQSPADMLRKLSRRR